MSTHALYLTYVAAHGLWWSATRMQFTRDLSGGARLVGIDRDTHTNTLYIYTILCIE